MSLLSLWQTSPEDIRCKRIAQLVSLAGSGKLKDGGETSRELREFLAVAPLDALRRYVDECLSEAFTDSGMVLQDLVNELGVRLGCCIEHGLYRGKVNAVGYDGIWRFPAGYALVVEVKTTDQYAISLDRIADYRKQLIRTGAIGESSSVLIVVGRNDTNSLEAQVRGSRHGWDIRLISADYLMKLVELKESADRKATIAEIRRVLTPLELTRVDFIVDLLARTTEEVQEAEETPQEEPEEETLVSEGKRFTPVAFHAAMIARLGKVVGSPLVRETRSLYVNEAGDYSVRVVASKAHPRSEVSYYWFAFHPYYREPLQDYARNAIAFGCGDPGKILLFDLAKFDRLTDRMNMSQNAGRPFHHVHIMEEPGGRIMLRLKGGEMEDITAYRLPD